MTSEDELERLIQRAQSDAREEAAFFRTMLEATIYALAPLSDDRPTLRLMMFTRPEGQTFVALFTHAAKAAASAGHLLRVVSASGRTLLEATRGAIVVINPNDDHCALYPEEVASLLDTGYVANVDCQTSLQDGSVWVDERPNVPLWLAARLRALYSTLPYVDAARIVAIGPEHQPDRRILTIVLVTTKAMAERAARATITAIQPDCRRHDVPVDITSIPSDGVPSSLSGVGVLLYERQRRH